MPTLSLSGSSARQPQHPAHPHTRSLSHPPPLPHTHPWPARYAEHSRQRLDLGLLSFFQNFRKVYVGEQVMHSSKVYLKLSERLGLSDHSTVLNVMLRCGGVVWGWGIGGGWAAVRGCAVLHGGDTVVHLPADPVWSA